ncbi:hypothetical protein QYM36_017905 [Artemia franciscana]|uniref:Sodium-dependent nutrient amino acid transporter 1 n=1 Tax=Artemia franciscana TaxID=6661 RepID=A0AA88H7Z6_ARTSF|nr:hypothetical protein QYM36_017905 [Artemia franciscana]
MRWINNEHSPPKYEYCNPAYEAEEASESIPEKPANCENEDPGPQRQQWGSPVEFLMSCISMSVGLGNVWRFPVTAYENGGGAFLIPYLIVLLIIGRPLYYLEMILGQFSGYGQVKIWGVVPLLKGPPCPKSMALEPVSEAEIAKIVNCLRGSSSSGPDPTCSTSLVSASTWVLARLSVNSKQTSNGRPFT